MSKSKANYLATFGSHHEINVIEAGLQLLEVQTENEIERNRKDGYEDDEHGQLLDLRLRRIKAARESLLKAERIAVAA